MNFSRIRGLLILLTIAAPAWALDPGTVTGTFTVDGKPIALRHAYAHLHDNAEGLLDRPRELRILLTDREVSPDTLRGIVFLPVEDLAMQGKVQGILFELDPANPNSLVATLLMPPSEPGASLVRTTHSVTGTKLFKRWIFERQRVVGEIERLSEPNPDLPHLSAASFALAFSAPVFNEPPVTADLRGRAARTSPQVQAVSAVARLLARGDLAGARKLQSRRSNRQFDAAMKLQGADAVKLAKQGGAEMKNMIGSVRRVVVRGDRAVVLVGKQQWLTLIREEGRWKMDL